MDGECEGVAVGAGQMEEKPSDGGPLQHFPVRDQRSGAGLTFIYLGPRGQKLRPSWLP